VVIYRHAHVSIQDNLHIVLRFRGSKALEFDADTAEEKYTICRLLGMILGGETANANGNVVWNFFKETKFSILRLAFNITTGKIQYEGASGQRI